MRGYKEVEVRQGDQFFDAFEDAVRWPSSCGGMPNR